MSSDRSQASSRPVPDLDAGKMTLLGHDLRAAVSDIIGGLRLIDLASVDEPTRLQLERVRASGEILARLLEQGLAQILGEDDYAATHPANLQMPRFLYDIEMRWSGRASEKGLGFQMTVAEDVPAVLTLDRIALERVLSNLLSNAIKYTDAGTVTLDVTMAASGALRLTVTDEGPGFSSEALARLFEFQGRPEGTCKPGEGLGMHITRHMAGQLGGTISVENLAARPGARVTLDLPPETWTIAAPDQAVELPDLSRTKVLVAEDNPTNQTIISHMLARMGAQYEIADDGVEALRWLERESFDLALIDIEMPRMNGIDVIRTLRANGNCHRRPHMPVIAITAYVLRANRDAIYAAGADAILAKPLAGLDTFGLAIANALGRRQNAEVGAMATAGADHTFDRSTFDRLIEVAGPDSALELLDRLAADLGKCERSLGAGLGDQDSLAVRAETHVLIALAGAVGAVRLQTLAEVLNAAAHRHDPSAFDRFGAEAMSQLDRLIRFVTEERARRGEAA
ncbi:MAG: response regulator [Rhodobacteraceae bacterium]|uniref:response regulator n=1 Tax=Albidovulum sp. TaxID=1872424 RepID=UPI001D9608FF|nr:response regulator [uncultured Defluviimonas sp.]MCB2126700.1 response regulator [Paracoccaceae bacterium]MCC0069980.1 response regulator [Paracoccaceae bacterium]